MSRLIPILLFLGACSSIVEDAKVGDCLRSKFEAGEYEVVKNDGEKLTVEERVPGKRLGQIKVIGKHYGGWTIVKCEGNQGEKF